MFDERRFEEIAAKQLSPKQATVTLFAEDFQFLIRTIREMKKDSEAIEQGIVDYGGEG